MNSCFLIVLRFWWDPKVLKVYPRVQWKKCKFLIHIYQVYLPASLISPWSVNTTAHVQGCYRPTFISLKPKAAGGRFLLPSKRTEPVCPTLSDTDPFSESQYYSTCLLQALRRMQSMRTESNTPLLMRTLIDQPLHLYRLLTWLLAQPYFPWCRGEGDGAEKGQRGECALAGSGGSQVP